MLKLLVKVFRRIYTNKNNLKQGCPGHYLNLKKICRHVKKVPDPLKQIVGPGPVLIPDGPDGATPDNPDLNAHALFCHLLANLI